MTYKEKKRHGQFWASVYSFSRQKDPFDIELETSSPVHKNHLLVKNNSLELLLSHLHINSFCSPSAGVGFLRVLRFPPQVVSCHCYLNHFKQQIVLKHSNKQENNTINGANFIKHKTNSSSAIKQLLQRQ